MTWMHPAQAPACGCAGAGAPSDSLRVAAPLPDSFLHALVDRGLGTSAESMNLGCSKVCVAGVLGMRLPNAA